MILVFFICLFLLLLILVIILSTISIRVDRLEVSNFNSENKLRYYYEMYLELYFLDKLKYLSIKVNKDKLNKLKRKDEKYGLW